MKVFNKKICAVVVFLLLIESCFIFLSIKSYMNKDIKETKEVSKVNKEIFSMYVENKETGEYEAYTGGDSFQIVGYKLNVATSNCVDNKGNVVKDIISYADNKVTITSNKTVFCYLYFDIDKSIYAKVVTDYSSNNGVIKLSSTSAETGNTYDVYYYRGNIFNNNVIYANHCWKMVLTTETNGVKLIYNGVPKEVDEFKKIEESKYSVSTNTPTARPFKFNSDTKEWVSGTLSDSQTATIEFTVAEAGDYVLSYTVDSEPNDKASFYLNGTALKSNIGGASQYGTIDLIGLTTSDVIKVTYIKNSYDTKYSDKVRISIGKLTGEKTMLCDNKGTSSQLTTRAFNSKSSHSKSSPAYVGYMYNKAYIMEKKNYITETSVLIENDIKNVVGAYYTYYYGAQAIWNEETNKYDLKNADGTALTSSSKVSWSNSLVGKYTCKSTSLTSCSTVHYVVGGSSYYMYTYAMSNGNTYDYYNIKMSNEEPIDNGDGTYTLVNPIEVTRKNLFENKSSYEGYYYCGDLKSETCGIDTPMYYLKSVAHDYKLEAINLNDVYKYGNSFEDTNNDGVYELKDTKEFWNLPENYNALSNNHYTCFNKSGECTDIKYIYESYPTSVYYITLTDGKTIEEAIDEMLYADDVNTTDSTIKDYIDTWYEENLLETKDANGVLYSKYLENTIFCNNREITSLGGWDSSGDPSGTEDLVFNKTTQCSNKLDRFTLKKEMGGTEGYGNNALDYPIGLLSYGEANTAFDNLTSKRGYLISGNDYWLLSPMGISFLDVSGYSIDSSSGFNSEGSYSSLNKSFGVRPALSLSKQVEINAGDGTFTNPYQVILPSE